MLLFYFSLHNLVGINARAIITRTSDCLLLQGSCMIF